MIKLKLQHFTYTLGILFILLSFSEFFYANALQNQISNLEYNISEMEKLRNNLEILYDDYYELYIDFLGDDWYINYKTIEGVMSDIEGEIILKSYIPRFLQLEIFLREYILLNYDNNDYKWLFFGEMMNLVYAHPGSGLRSSLSQKYSIERTSISGWKIEIYNEEINPFIWDKTLQIMYDNLGDKAPFIVVVDFFAFDYYVKINYLYPLIKAQELYNRLVIVTSANTIGLLLLGFIIDFGDIGKIWKRLYLILALISVNIAIFSSSITIINIFGG